MHTDVESGGTSVSDRRRSVFLDQGKHSQDAANTGLCLLLIDQLTELADPGSGVLGPVARVVLYSAAFSWGGPRPGSDIHRVSGAGAHEEVGWCSDAECARVAHPIAPSLAARSIRSEEHTSELQSQSNLVCRLLLEKKKIHHTQC